MEACNGFLSKKFSNKWFKFLLMSKNNLNWTNDLNWIFISKNPNLTSEIIDKYPNKPWYWYYISQNPNLTIDWIIKYPNKSWDWNCISEHKNITMNDIINNINLSWNYQYISQNPNLTLEMLELFIDKPWNFEKWDWDHISNNLNLTINWIIKYPDKPWNWDFISRHPNIKIQDIEDNINLPWDWSGISINSNLTSKIIDKYPNKPWNWHFMSCIVKMEIFDKYPNKPWHWEWISMNPNITLKQINKYPNNRWNLQYLSINPNLTIDWILTFYNKKYNKFNQWDWNFISINNKNITIQDMISLFPHNFYDKISINPNLTIDKIKEIKESDKSKKLDYYWSNISENITMKDICDNPNYPWDINSLSKNTFKKDKQNYINNI